jgi:hypothetical protein
MGIEPPNRPGLVVQMGHAYEPLLSPNGHAGDSASGARKRERAGSAAVREPVGGGARAQLAGAAAGRGHHRRCVSRQHLELQSIPRNSIGVSIGPVKFNRGFNTRRRCSRPRPPSPVREPPASRASIDS